MKTLEFKTRVKNNQIQIPAKVQSKLKEDRDIKVIVLLEDSDSSDDFVFKKTTSTQFFEGYADSDSIYDN